MPELWVDKYRPKTLDEFVWRDGGQRKQVEEWIASGSVPISCLAGSKEAARPRWRSSF